METNETFEPVSPAPVPGLSLEAQTYLREAGKWARFLGIIGFIGCGFILIAALTIGTLMSRIAVLAPNPMITMMAGMGGFLAVFYILIGIVHFFFSLYLYQFGDKIKKGVMFTDTVHLTSAFEKLKSFFKLWGIITIVVLCLYALLIICVVIAGIAGASMMR